MVQFTHFIAGQMEWLADEDVSEKTLEDFSQNQCYLRFKQVCPLHCVIIAIASQIRRVTAVCGARTIAMQAPPSTLATMSVSHGISHLPRTCSPCDCSSIPSLPLFANDRLRKQSTTVCGTTRPLSSFSLVEVLLFQRTYLRILDHVCPDCIM